MPALTPRAWVLAAAVALMGLLGLLYAASPQVPHALVLLVPDAAALERPEAQAWVDAAREEGLPLVPMTDDEFMRFSGDRHAIPGVILPDTVHKAASDLLVNQLHGYVSGGGKLFVAFDAAVLNTQSGGYASGQSRLSRLVGVRYAMYDDLRDLTIARGAVYGTRETEKALGLQPGKLDFKYSSHPHLGELTTYGYVRLHHNYFRTGVSLGGQGLLNSFDGDVIVGRNRFGKGEVLFANLPLGYLKTRTDAYMLHRLLGHFSNDVAKLPRLTPVPGGQGGLVLNLHIDSNAAQAPLLQLEQWGWFKDGPFSMHVTAGPDTYEPGDQLGLDLNNNPVMRDFLRRQAALGHEMGNHGGWNHDIFGDTANEGNRAQFEPWLALNNEAMSRALGKPMRVYSAPQGNQPVWATRWLEKNGFKAYYFTGDTGLGPTRSYYEGKRPQPILWAFPVSNLLKIATFEELDHPKTPLNAEDIGNFLIRLSNYAADNRVARLFYFHPPAAPRYAAVMDGFMAEARKLSQQGRFRWYTMERLADFMTRREATQWQVERRSGARGYVLHASNPAGLQELAWTFPAAMGARAEVRKGQASVQRTGDQWVVLAGEGRELAVEFR
jgi:hypothetical protein